MLETGAMTGSPAHSEPLPSRGNPPGPATVRRGPGLLGLLLVAGIGVACAGPPSPESVPSDDLDARRALFLVSPEELAALREGGDASLVILEVGSDPDLFASGGHVAGARFLPWEAVAMRRDDVPNQIPPLELLAERLRERGVTDASRIVLYDRGAGLQAGRAWAVLDYAGLGDRTRLLDGQLAGWRASGGEVAIGTPEEPSPEATPGGLSLTPRPAAVLSGDRVADMVWVRSSQSPATLLDVHLLDARPAEEFAGEVPGDEVLRPGHIPGARNLPWRTTTGPDEAPYFLDAAALRDLFLEAGVAPGSPVVTYCRTGGQAGHLYFVARMLGHDARLYDGSFVEWSRDTDRPVVAPRTTDAPEPPAPDTP
jgi:thiosulfate/3-mercaptopyruvate sulfurtransferase